MFPVIVLRGAGDLATGVAFRLFRAGFKFLLLLETENPLAVRREVSFSSAMKAGEMTVEGIQAVRITGTGETLDCWQQGKIPVLCDPTFSCCASIRPDIVIDAILAKRNLGTNLSLAPLVIGLGPGFTAGEDVHVVIETQRGHFLGRSITEGSAAPNTGIPGAVNGYTTERVRWAEKEGVFFTTLSIGEMVCRGEELGRVDSQPVIAGVDGVIRGLLPDGTAVKKGTKLCDVDPRKNVEHCYTISDKALAIGGGVLEVVSAFCFRSQN